MTLMIGLNKSETHHLNKLRKCCESSFFSTGAKKTCNSFQPLFY